MDIQEEKLRRSIEIKIKKIFDLRKKKEKFIPGKTFIQYAGSVFDDNEVNAMVSTIIDGWFGLGKQASEFETKLAQFIGAKGSILTNSGSSSNLLAVAALMSPFLENHLKRGDEVITAACGFPTTINPLILFGLTPVFLDINPETYNLDIKDLEKALSKKTRAVMVAHTLGNPNQMDGIKRFCKEHKLFLIEDNCDALGSEYDGKKTGSFGVMTTQSFYPPHHLTMGEGGAVVINDYKFERIVRSLRDWGRACWCSGAEKNRFGACGKRFSYKINGKPYDHKYIFNQIGFNLKPIEPQAAMGVKQFKRLPFFIKKREANFKRLNNYAKKWENYFILPKSLPKAKACWFAYPLTIKKDVKFSRYKITTYLENNLIQTRPLFAGNIIRQPAYAKIKYRKIGSLKHSDLVLHNTFFIGIYPGLGNEQIDYMAHKIEKFLKKYK